MSAMNSTAVYPIPAIARRASSNVFFLNALVENASWIMPAILSPRPRPVPRAGARQRRALLSGARGSAANHARARTRERAPRARPRFIDQTLRQRLSVPVEVRELGFAREHVAEFLPRL